MQDQDQQTDAPAPTESDLLSGGRQLRETRESRGLSVDDVARQLHLSVQQIVALEEEDFSRLPQPTYVCGYLRNYARFLGLDSDQLISRYPNLETVLSRNPLPESGRITQQDIEQSSRGVPVSLAAAVVLIVVVTALWFLFSGDDSEPEQPARLDSPATAPAVVSQEVAKPLAEASGDAPADTEVITAPTEAKDKAESAAVKPAPAPVVVPAPVAATAPKPAAPTAVAPAATVAAAPEVPAAPVVVEEEPAEPTMVPASKLVARFSQDSWTDVTDAQGKQVLYRLGRAGHEVTVIGVAPFRAFFGYVPGVELELNGEAVDMSSYQQMQKATIKVGSESSNSMDQAFRSDQQPQAQTRTFSLPAVNTGGGDSEDSGTAVNAETSELQPQDDSSDGQAETERPPSGGRVRPAPITNLLEDN